MDLYARKIIAWTLADTMEVSTVIETINKAKACRNTDLPLIIHSDRGSQYVSNAWREATEKMQQSYSHSGWLCQEKCVSFLKIIKIMLMPQIMCSYFSIRAMNFSFVDS